MRINAVFTSTDWGKTEGVARSEEGLVAGGQVFVSESEGPAITEVVVRDGREVVNPRGFNSLLRFHIKAPAGASVSHISLRKRREGELGIYPHILEIDAQGPKGLSSGSLHLEFVDQTGPSDISIWSSIPRVHVLGLESGDPVIKMIRWYHTNP